MSDLTIVQPDGRPVPHGSGNGVYGTGRVIVVGGQIGWNEQGEFAEGFVAQTAQTPRNILTVVRQAGGQPEHIARLTWHVLDIQDYRDALAALGAAHRAVPGRWYPAMTMVQVAGLVEPDALLEIEATATLPSTV